MSEVWLPVVGYEGKYEVSNTGLVRSVDREVFNRGSGRAYTLKGQALKVKKDRDGYLIVSPCVDGVNKYLRVHRVVASAFLSNPENKAHVNHINGDKSDNSVSNLEWVSHVENMRHAKHNGLLSTKGRAVIGTSLCGVEVRYESVMDAHRSGHSRNGIHQCLCGNYKTSGGMRWRYA